MQCIQYTPYTARKATNKIIKVEVGRSPYISWELLKARLIVKKAVLCMAGPGGSRHALLQGMPALCDAAANQVDSESFHSINNDKARHKWDTDVCVSQFLGMQRFYWRYPQQRHHYHYQLLRPTPSTTSELLPPLHTRATLAVLFRG